MMFFASFNKNEDCTSFATYLHSSCWNYCISVYFIGKYDYENSKNLYKNMTSIQDILNSDENLTKIKKIKNFLLMMENK